MAMNLFLWASIIWIVPLMYFMQKNETKVKKNIIVGVTLPYEAREDEEVQEILKHYIKRLKWTCILLLAAAVVCMPIKDIGIMMTLYLVWIDAAIVVMDIPYIMCNKALKALKERRGWKKGRSEMTVNLQVNGNPVKWISPVWFLLPLLVSLIPFLWERTMWLIYVTDAALVLFSWFGYRVMFRSRSEAVDGNMEIAEALTRIRRYHWGKSWLFTAWFAALLNLVMWLTMHHFWLNMACVLGLAAILTVLVVRVEFKVRKLQEKLTRDSGKEFYVDEDDYWIWGILYYNPDDKKLLINNRTGMNMSFNLARTSGKVIMLLLLLLLLGMPFVGVWLIYEERQPVVLTVSEDVLTASHTDTTYEIELSEIQTAELLEERPKMRKLVGTGMDSVLKGKFRISGVGGVQTCLDPRTGPWLFLTMEDGTRYIVGSSTEGTAEEIWETVENFEDI